MRATGAQPQESGRQAKHKKPREGRANVFWARAQPSFFAEQGGGIGAIKKSHPFRVGFMTAELPSAVAAELGFEPRQYESES